MRDFKKGIILLLLTITSCNSQVTKIDGEITVRQDENVKIEFNFYPSSGGSVIYTIKYYVDILYDNMQLVKCFLVAFRGVRSTVY